jgi:hypothetical protein
MSTGCEYPLPSHTYPPPQGDMQPRTCQPRTCHCVCTRCGRRLAPGLQHNILSYGGLWHSANDMAIPQAGHTCLARLTGTCPRARTLGIHTHLPAFRVEMVRAAASVTVHQICPSARRCRHTHMDHWWCCDPCLSAYTATLSACPQPTS